MVARVVILGLAALLAGCSNAPAPQSDEAPAPVIVTDPRDVPVTNDGSHVHDYWGGRDSFVLLDGESTILTQSNDGDTHAGDFRPPEGSIVPQGTGIVEARADWELNEDGGVLGSFPSDFDRMELWVQTSNDSEPHRVGPIEKGGTLRFDSTNEQADPPHYVLSLWRFDLVAVNDDGDATFNGRSLLQATVFRTLPLPVFPPHPDRWQGASELLLADAEHDVPSHVATPTFSFCQGCLPILAPDPGLVVPHDATEVRVTVTPTAGTSAIPLGLRSHGADTWGWTEVPPTSPLPGERVFVIPVEASGDSPYAKQSLWEFWIHIDLPQDTGAWSGELRVVVTAHR